MTRQIGAALAMLIVCVCPAAAETTRFQLIVARADLDLDDPADALVMAERLDEGARRACGGSPRFYPEYRHARAWSVEAFETCRAAALERALADLNAPEVTAAVLGERANAARGRD